MSIIWRFNWWCNKTRSWINRFNSTSRILLFSCCKI